MSARAQRCLVGLSKASSPLQRCHFLSERHSLLWTGHLSQRYSSTSTSSWRDRLPLIIRPSFWKSMIPKPLREIEEEKRRKNPKRNEWNPATYFILIFLLIGSNAIHFVNLKRKYAIDSRQADNKILLLREVLRKLQNREEVDVEKVLGSGDPLSEKEWDDGAILAEQTCITKVKLTRMYSAQEYRRRRSPLAFQAETERARRGKGCTI